MARKPSIFSSNYERKMKKRKKRMLYIIIIIILICGIVFMLSLNSTRIRGVLNNGIQSIKSSFAKNESTQKNEIKPNKQKVTEEDKKVIEQKEVKKDKVENKEVNVNLKSGNNIKLDIQQTDNEKVIKSIGLNENSMTYNLSPSGKNAIVYEKNTQTVNYIDVNGKVEDITYKQYRSSSGKRFKKESILSQNPNYTWAKSPKFIDEENIVYLTSLPWFNKKGNEYIWIYNIKKKTYKSLRKNGKKTSGNDIKFKMRTDKGLEVEIDNTTKYITPNGIID